MRLLHSVEESMEILGGMSRSVIYEEIKAGRLNVLKIGRRTYLTHAELEHYVSKRVDSANA